MGDRTDDANRRTPADAPTFLVEDLGGTTTAREFRGRPFHQSARSLDNAEFARFGAGAVVFDKHFDARRGLGPTFNEDSCLSCHVDLAKNNPSGPTDPGPGLLVRLSVAGSTSTGAPMMEPTYGLQIQNRSVSGAEPEGRLDVEWEMIDVTFGDGTTSRLRRPKVRISELADGPLAPGTMTSLRVAPPIIGLGLLEAITADDLVTSADPDDRDGDGISGRVNRVWNAALGETAIGRFGWKAGQPTVAQQSVGALHDDMGMTSADAADHCGNQGSSCAVVGIGPGPEMSASDLADQIFYNRTIAVPVARGIDRGGVRRGAREFVDIGCASCHATTQESGPDEVAGLANQVFHPFTDLLLHDMGAGLADGRPEFGATGSEWRTPPLWGLGLRAEVTGSSTLLHDGRARSPEEAILWHGGEARTARERYRRSSSRQRRDLLAFLGAI